MGCEREQEEILTGLFMNFRVISRASGGRVAEKTPTCTPRPALTECLWSAVSQGHCRISAAKQSRSIVPSSMHACAVMSVQQSCSFFTAKFTLAVPRDRHGTLSCAAHLQLGRQQLEDVIDLVLETAREHLVGLVQHEHPDGVSPQGAAAQHVVHASGRAHNHVHSSLEDASVLTHAGATHTGVALDLQSIGAGQRPCCAASGSAGLIRQRSLWILHPLSPFYCRRQNTTYLSNCIEDVIV